MTDIAVRFGFVDVDEKEREPAMGLYPVRRGRPPMFAIPLSSAYKYTDAKYLAETSFKIAEMFGMHPDQFIINRIADTILSNIDALIKHVDPEEQHNGQAFAEGAVKIDGDTVQQFEAYTDGRIVL